MTCSPNQSKFVEIVKTEKNAASKEYITEINLYMNKEYTEGTYQSCKQVSVPSTGQLALDIMCGSWAAAKCTAERWFTFMGTKEGNAFVPFQMNYKFLSEPVGDFIPYNPPITPCNKGINVSVGNLFIFYNLLCLSLNKVIKYYILKIIR